MATPVEIGQAGEAAVVSALKQKDWTITNWNTQAPGSTDIEASYGTKKLLVQVKSAVSPKSPASLSAEEERNIKSRAARISAEAYEATVTFNQNLQSTAINWRKLN